jgi:(4-O-methyl)-D-glucuronate---lignin esterase
MQARIRLVPPALAILVMAVALPHAQQPPGNYDEAKVPAYTLPDPLVMADGTRVTTADAWTSRRRPELLQIFEREVYGRPPASRLPLRATVDSTVSDALGGTAIRRQVTLRFAAGSEAPAMHLLLYVPATAKGPVPVFLALNFQGNQAVHAEPGIALATSWLPDDDAGVVNHRATESSRGTESGRFPLAQILAKGYGLATAYYGDLDPDYDNFQNGVHPLFYKGGQTRPAPGEWGAIGAWAWGLSRALDYLETDASVNARAVAVVGHSRLGKAALWAGAQDPRFAMVVSNESGCGGAALSKRIFGETVEAITRQFPHWFTSTFTRYANNEAALPVDQHELLALIAPRPLYVASAAEDLWADPRGEFLSAQAAEPVYRLLGATGLGVDAMPPIDRPVGGTIGYHVRHGGHDLSAYDWEQFITFADRHVRR